MARGVDLATLGRCWGRAGVLAVVLLSACSSVATAPVAPDAAPAASASRADVPAPSGLPAPGDASETAIAPPPVTFNGPPPAAAPPPAALAAPAPATGATRGTGVWSVVIGINDYPGSGHDLEYADNDAHDMDVALYQAGVPAEQRVDLRDGQATAATIRRGLDWLAAHAGPDSTAVFFYAGHVRKLGADREALVGADGEVVTDQEMAQHLTGLRAGRAWIVIAGCYGGGFTEVLAPGRILTAAAPANGLAYETTAYHRSYLVEYMIHRGMLEAQGGPSIQSAFGYAWSALRSQHPDRLPVEYDDLGQPLVLGSAATYPAPAPAPPEATASSPGSAPPAQPASTTTTTAPAQPQPKRQCLLTAGSTVRCPDD